MKAFWLCPVIIACCLFAIGFFVVKRQFDRTRDLQKIAGRWVAKSAQPGPSSNSKTLFDLNPDGTGRFYKYNDKTKYTIDETVQWGVVKGKVLISNFEYALAHKDDSVFSSWTGKLSPDGNTMYITGEQHRNPIRFVRESGKTTRGISQNEKLAR